MDSASTSVDSYLTSTDSTLHSLKIGNKGGTGSVTLHSSNANNVDVTVTLPSPGEVTKLNTHWRFAESGDVRITVNNDIEASNVVLDSFMLSRPFINLTSSGSPEWKIGGHKELITWESQGTTGTADISFSTNDGASWTTLVSATTNDGTEFIDVPDAPCTSGCKIRVATASSEGISDYGFTIVALGDTDQSIITTQLPTGFSTAGQYELGTKFKTAVDGIITNVSIYTDGVETGIHEVRIWRESGSVLLAGPYDWPVPSSGGAGWKSFTLPSELNVFAGTDYIVSVSTGRDERWSAMVGGFASPINNGDLITYTGSGVYTATMGTMPSAVFQNANYFRDITFVPYSFGSVSDTIMTSQVPAVFNTAGTYELGTQFKTAVDGDITGVRIYTDGIETGDHEVRIWRESDATVLSGPHTWSVTTGSQGWRNFTLPAALSITANTDYVVSVATGSDERWSGTADGFALPINNGDLITYTGSGVYSTVTGTMPTMAFQNSNYFRDVVFVAEPRDTILTTQVPAEFMTAGTYELGTQFETLVNGDITGVRIYTDGVESGVHEVRIWRESDGVLLSGPHSWSVPTGSPDWRSFTLPTALNVTAGTKYVVSVATGSDQRRSQTFGGFNSPINNGDLITYTGSGVYTTTIGTIPTLTFQNSNYFRDVMFVPD
jgi:hypothetical protein